MLHDDKSKYSDKQRYRVEHVEESYKVRGMNESGAEARTWATMNKQPDGGERKGGSGHAKSETAKRTNRRDSVHYVTQAHSGRPASRGPVNRGKRQDSTLVSEITREELIQLARKRNIRSCSTMHKIELIGALSRA